MAVEWIVLGLLAVLFVAIAKWPTKTEQLAVAPKQTFPGEVPGASEKWPETNWLAHASVNGEKLATYRHLPPKSTAPKALLFMWHGWNEHMQRHAHVARKFAEKGYICVGMDMRGHGASEGLRGYIDSYHKFVDDALDFVFKVREIYKNLPVFTYGVSMGGKTSLHLALRHPELFTGLILGVPAIVAKEDLSPVMQKLARYIAWLFPKLVVVKLPQGLGSRNQAAIDHYFNDPVCYHGGVRAGTGHALLESCRFLTARVSQISTPFIVIQGSEDLLVEPKGTRMLYETTKLVSKEDKEMVFWPGLWHDIIHEPEAWEVIDRFIAWADKRVELAARKTK